MELCQIIVESVGLGQSDMMVSEPCYNDHDVNHAYETAEVPLKKGHKTIAGRAVGTVRQHWLLWLDRMGHRLPYAVR